MISCEILLNQSQLFLTLCLPYSAIIHHLFSTVVFNQHINTQRFLSLSLFYQLYYIIHLYQIITCIQFNRLLKAFIRIIKIIQLTKNNSQVHPSMRKVRVKTNSSLQVMISRTILVTLNTDQSQVIHDYPLPRINQQSLLQTSTSSHPSLLLIITHPYIVIQLTIVTSYLQTLSILLQSTLMIIILLTNTT